VIERLGRPKTPLSQFQTEFQNPAEWAPAMTRNRRSGDVYGCPGHQPVASFAGTSVDRIYGKAVPIQGFAYAVLQRPSLRHHKALLKGLDLQDRDLTEEQGLGIGCLKVPEGLRPVQGDIDGCVEGCGRREKHLLLAVSQGCSGRLSGDKGTGAEHRPK